MKLLANPEDLAGLVVLDTWILNCDRHCPAIHPTRINLIQLKEFRQQREGNLLKEASVTAVGGHYLYRHADPVRGERQLILVASLGEEASEQREKLSNLFKEQDVVFFTDAEDEKLATLIATTGH